MMSQEARKFDLRSQKHILEKEELCFLHKSIKSAKSCDAFSIISMAIIPKGVDVVFIVKFEIYNRAKQGQSAYRISKDLGIDKKNVKKWSHAKTIKRIGETENFAT